MMSHETLENWYMTIFSLMQHHKYSLQEIESMIVFEKQLYIQMLLDHINSRK